MSVILLIMICLPKAKPKLAWLGSLDTSCSLEGYLIFIV